MKKLNFLIVDDELLIREGLIALLKNEPFVRSIKQAGNKKEFADQFSDEIDFILLDFKMGDTNGLELLQSVKSKKREVKVVALTGLEGSELILNMLKAGVNGIVYKLDGYNQILKTIERIMAGESFFSEKVVGVIQKNAHRWDNVPPVKLNFTEVELLISLSKGLTSKEIAVNTKMAEATIETYRLRLIKKVGVLNTASLIAYGFRNGLL